ncbi:OmpA family protein [Empedobacter brevis]|uniref:OmpA family protein n=1 Tax=Empedobacter brevis TaxID=247 RepID=UPI00289EC7C3|nr:OmpA family protein [Empedobacter brevis]
MNIIELVKGYITPDLISKTSSELGESDSGISKAINAFIPIILGGVLEKKNSTTGLFHTIKTFGASRGLANISTEQQTPDTIKELIQVIFGSNAQPIISKVSEYAGISTASSSKLFDLTALTTFGSIGKEAEFNHVSESDFFSSLGGIKDKIVGLIPAGLGLGSLGLGTMFNDSPEITETIDIATDHITETVTETRKVVDVEPEEKPYVAPVDAYAETHHNNNSGGGFWKWIIPLIILALAAFFLLKYCKGKEEKTVVTEETEIVVDSLAEPREISTIDLDGVALRGYANGLEDQIIKFIKAPEFATMTEDQLKEKWFNFDNVNFVFGKTDQLEAGSEIQLDNIAAILKKYPTAKIKLGAYSDKKGDDAKNKEISQQRADFLKAELTKRGVGAQIAGAEGYGEEFAKVPETASDEERASDRKMSLRFTK